MATLRVLIGVLLAGVVTPARADGVSRWAVHIEEASARFDVPAAWIARVMHAESRGRTEWAGRPITSAAGAMGLMQLMPGTWRDMRERLQLGDDPHQPRDNILAGAFYLRLMYDRFGYPGLFAAYNAGPARYARYLLTGEPLPRETRAYLADVSGPREAPPRKPSTSPPSVRTLFFTLQSETVSAGTSGRADLFVR